MPIAFPLEAPARPVSVPAVRQLQNQCADKRLQLRPVRAGGARFYLAVLIGRYLRPSSQSVMPGIVDSGRAGGLAISTRMTRCCLTAAFAIDGRSSPGSGRLRMLMAVEPVTLFCRA